MRNRLLQIRLQRGFKYAKDFSEFLEINNQQYSRYESNVRQPNVETVYKILKKLNITFEELIYEDEHQ